MRERSGGSLAPESFAGINATQMKSILSERGRDGGPDWGRSVQEPALSVVPGGPEPDLSSGGSWRGLEE